MAINIIVIKPLYFVKKYRNYICFLLFSQTTFFYTMKYLDDSQLFMNVIVLFSLLFQQKNLLKILSLSFISAEKNEFSLENHGVAKQLTLYFLICVSLFSSEAGVKGAPVMPAMLLHGERMMYVKVVIQNKFYYRQFSIIYQLLHLHELWFQMAIVLTLQY